VRFCVCKKRFLSSFFSVFQNKKFFSSSFVVSLSPSNLTFTFFHTSGSSLCVYCTPLSFATTCPLPTSLHFVVSKPSTPTGPLA
jgi:hypothetical protein